MAWCMVTLWVSAEPAAEMASFEEKRAQFHSGLSEVLLPLLQRQQKEVQALEVKAAAAADYDAALAARDHRKKIEAQIKQHEKMQLLYSAQQQTQRLQEVIQLKLEDAKLSGPRLVEGALVDWKQKGASATWTLPNLPAGGYEVVLRYQSTAYEGGTLVLQESFYQLKAALTTTLKDSAEQSLGTLRVRDGAGSLTLSAETVLGENLMRLEAIYLIPADH
jgi:hypothetical protein